LTHVWRLYKTGFGLTTGFIGLHSVTHNQSQLCLLQLQLTLTTESQLLLSLSRAQDLLQTQLAHTGHQLNLLNSRLRLGFASKQAVAYCRHSPAWLFLVLSPIGTHAHIFLLIHNPYGIRKCASSSVRGVCLFNAAGRATRRGSRSLDGQPLTGRLPLKAGRQAGNSLAFGAGKRWTRFESRGKYIFLFNFNIFYY
jgi:hypothetical protein